jgi:hypothetical protein
MNDFKKFDHIQSTLSPLVFADETLWAVKFGSYVDLREPSRTARLDQRCPQAVVLVIEQ